MLAPPMFPSFERAYIEVLRHVSEDYEFRNAPRGNTSRESLGLSFQLSDPRSRTPFLNSRKINPIYHFAEALWYLGGRSDLAMIGYYAPRRHRDSHDGVTIDGSAYGARIFQQPYEQAVELLQGEKDSKRAVLPVFRAGELADPQSPDVPCLLALHLLLREGRLHMVCYMRANDADRGLIADVFSFTLIQEFTACVLGVDLGTYTHHVGSMHIGEPDMPRVEQVIAESIGRRSELPRFAPPVMPTDTGWPQILQVLEHEEALRLNRIQYTPEDIAVLGLAPYWQQVVLLFEVQRQLVHCAADPVDLALIAALSPALRWQVTRRWPGRMPVEVRL
ncbi:thymidylate synthase [Kitasatospora atroaurantiaca]|uniref:Thymidylate synthase n=1 Tax=Kitasatospora atroaurantiaca TaxID=285545 RepID=A0A561EMY5_9ACTN|nr:thymidylate synthase [Kitasatospora atroaurantiaca]TWE16983.1 thymidylate synthase [Kitasatospora atroaurantiaca]